MRQNRCAHYPNQHGFAVLCVKTCACNVWSRIVRKNRCAHYPNQQGFAALWVKPVHAMSGYQNPFVLGSNLIPNIEESVLIFTILYFRLILMPSEAARPLRCGKKR